MRRALLRGLSGARSVRLHARLAAALHARGPLGPERVLEVAHHLAAAALDALSAYRTSGPAFFEPTFTMLLAEVHDRAGDDVGAHAAAGTAAAATRRTGEVAHGPRLRVLARRLVRTHV